MAALAGSRSRRRRRDVLDLEVLVDPEGTALAAVARLLEPAEGAGGVRGIGRRSRRRCRSRAARRHAAGGRSRASGSTPRARRVCRSRSRSPRPRCRTRVSPATGPKVSSRVDQHVAGDAVEHRRLEEGAAVEAVAAEALAAERRAGAPPRDGIVDVRAAPSRSRASSISGPIVDALAQPLADDELRDLLGEGLEEPVVDPALDVDAVRADAGLARVAELRGDQRRRRPRPGRRRRRSRKARGRRARG